MANLRTQSACGLSIESSVLLVSSKTYYLSDRGTPLVHASINRHLLKPICRELGIPIGTTHAFRHGRVSVLQKARVQGDLIRE